MALYVSPAVTEITNYICTPLSLFGVGYMLHGFHSSENKTFPAKLVVSLAYANLILCIVNILEFFPTNNTLCIIEGFLGTFSVYANVMWTLLILLALYLQFIWSIPRVSQHYWTLMWINLLSSLGVPVWALISDLTGGYYHFAVDLGACGIAPPDIYNIIFGIPFGVIVTLCFYFTIKVYNALKELPTSLLNIEYKDLFIYPTLLLVYYVPIGVDSIIASKIEGGWEPLSIFCQILFRSLGWINALMYRKNQNNERKIRSNSLDGHEIQTSMVNLKEIGY